MRYLSLIWADGRPSPEDIAVLQRELPAWDERMGGRGVRLFGRELELPRDSATVRVRAGETIVSDGPFAETKEFIAGFDVLDCDQPAQAIEFAVECPISRIQPIEVRPFDEGLELDERALAFGRGEDGGGRPFLLSPWIDPASAANDRDREAELEAWRQDMRARRLHVLGHSLGGPETATTVRRREGRTQLSGGPFTAIPDFMCAVDVLSCADRAQALECAAAHPLARRHAVEVRPFYREPASD